jgi:predicted dehydrogenase
VRPLSVGLVGGSWRARYYLRIAQQLPERFSIKQILVKHESTATQISEDWGVHATTNMSAFISDRPYDFVVVSVPRTVAPEITVELLNADIPVLAETPPASDEESLRSLYSQIANAPVQIAEQYQFQPHHAARLAVVRQGLIGDVSGARVSVAHDYHGISLLRLVLGVGFEPVEIAAVAQRDPVWSARGRDGWSEELTNHDGTRVNATLQFPGASGVYEFCSEQYWSPIRSRHMSIYGTSGEVQDDDVRRLVGPGQAAHQTLYREATGIDGDLEGLFLRRILLGDMVCYVNPFVPARFSDDEIAGAEVLQRMGEYVNDGTPFYGIADASHDVYLSLLVARAVRTGARVRTEKVPWDRELSAAQR